MAAEKNFENRIKDFLKEHGCWIVKYWGGGLYTKDGIPDILCCCRGVFIGIEVKAPNGRPSDLQLVNLQKIDEAEGYGVLLYPDQFDVFKDFILGIDRFDFDAIQDSYKILKERWVNECHKRFK